MNAFTVIAMSIARCAARPRFNARPTKVNLFVASKIPVVHEANDTLDPVLHLPSQLQR
jgi:hypothetical protein